MAWEWSHTNEAYENARHNLERIDPAELRVIWAEWKAQRGEHGAFDSKAYTVALNDCQPLGPVRLTSDIWEWAAENRTCDNGGFNAHMCPYGCSPHCVSFDEETPS